MNSSLQTIGAGASARRSKRTKTAAAVDYQVRSASTGRIVPNRSAAAALRRHSDMQLVLKRMDLAYAGAVVLQLLVEAPWLASCTFYLSAEPAYDDEGGYYRSISAVVDDITTVQDASFAAPVFDQGQFDEDAAVEWIETQVQEVDWALYGAFRASDNYEDLDLVVSRVAVASLLDRLAASGVASGSAACRALWPQADNLTRQGS